MHKTVWVIMDTAAGRGYWNEERCGFTTDPTAVTFYPNRRIARSWQKCFGTTRKSGLVVKAELVLIRQ